MRKSEHDFPNRAEYAAALNWREVFVIAGSYDYSQPVLGRDSVGPMRRWLISMRERRLPSGRRNWIRHLFGLFWVVVASPVAIGVTAYGDWALEWFLLGVGIAVFAVVASQAAFIAGAVLAFRVGGWEQVLRDRDRDSAWKEQLKVMLGDEDTECNHIIHYCENAGNN